MNGYLHSRSSFLVDELSPRGATPEHLLRNAFRLRDLSADWSVQAVKGPLARPIFSLATDSRRVLPGAVFFALPADGRPASAASIDEAVRRGAVAVVVRRLPLASPAKVTFVQVADVRLALARASRRFFRFPDHDLTAVGVTGGRGKTTVAHLLKELLGHEGRTGLLSTIHYDLGARTVPAFMTTPEAVDLHGMMAQMRDAGCRMAVVELDAAGISEQRALGLQLGAAIFTGCAPAGEGECEAMRRMFVGGIGAIPDIAVVNADDEGGRALLQLLVEQGGAGRAITYGTTAEAQVRAESIVCGERGTTFRLIWPGGELAVESPLIGRFNVENLLAAAATVWGLGCDLPCAIDRLRTYRGVPGRMERIDEGQDFGVFVDRADEDESLRQALEAVRAVTTGNVLMVFDGDAAAPHEERAKVARAVQELADFGIATAGHGLAESSEKVFDELRAGVTEPDKFAWMEDRRRAIAAALDLARPGDSVVIAGRGHAACHKVADMLVPFDDRQVAREILGAARHNRPS